MRAVPGLPVLPRSLGPWCQGCSTWSWALFVLISTAADKMWGAQGGENQFAEESRAAMALGAHRPGAAGSYGPHPALRCRAWVSAWATARLGSRQVLSCHRHAVTARHGDNCVPYRQWIPIPGEEELSSLGKLLTQKSPPRAQPRHPRSLKQLGVPKLMAFARGAPVPPALGTFWFAVHGGLQQHIPLGLGSVSRVAVALSCCLSVHPPAGAGARRAPPSQQSPPMLPLPEG